MAEMDMPIGNAKASAGNRQMVNAVIASVLGWSLDLFDLFILLDGLLYIFQITVELNHDINHRLIDVANKYSFPLRDQWCFVVIILPNMTLTVPQLALQDLVLPQL